ncbi:MAG: type VII secretion protein EccCb, partial [Stackebrandtia sp.]
MLSQLVTLASPDDVRIAVVRHNSVAAQWDWLLYAPHVLSDSDDTHGLPEPLLCGSVSELSDRLAPELQARRADLRRRRGGPPGPGTQHPIIVVDSQAQAATSGTWDEDPDPADLGIHVLNLVAAQRTEPENVDVRVTATGDDITVDQVARRRQALARSGEDGDDPPFAAVTGEPDTVDFDTAAGIVRALSPYRLAETEGSEALHSVHGLADILGVDDPASFDPLTAWRSRDHDDMLRVPLGVGAEGEIVDLDLKESAMGGMGPHGLIIGATGSGKSEALRTLVAALATRHGPEELALLTVDFKGGATFADYDALPHNAGAITNLADDLALVDRFSEALFGEMLRRQQLLKDVGNLPNAHAYQKLRRSRTDLPPLPHLLVIIDEFSELLTAKPGFSELFLAAGRIGRSIGVHLLLATQRLESGHIRGLESHLSYRIGLRTFSEAESREAIGVPDAYRLPPEPGSGYLKVDTSIFTRFKAAMVSGPYLPPLSHADTPLPVLPWPPPPVGVDDVVKALESWRPTEGEPEAEPRTVLQVLVDRITATGASPVRPVWLPPLPPVLPLDAVSNGSGPGPADEPGNVTAVLGLHDKPREQAQEPWTWDLTGSDANLLILGAPVSGKSTLVRTMIASLALRYPPGQVACYCVDYGGGALTPLAELPHVATVATRAEPELVRRTLADVANLLDTRESVMRQYKLDSADELRRARADGIVPADTAGDVVLIIDGWGALRDTDMELDDVLMDIAGRGPALGVHTVLTAVNSVQVRSRLSASFGGRIELRLTDAFDSGIARKAAEALPKDTPGRALLPDEMYGQVALPRIDGLAIVDDLQSAIGTLVAEVNGRWRAPAVPPVRVLPSMVTLDELLPPAEPGVADAYAMTPILGVSERDLGPAVVDFESEPHLVIFGDPQTGKSTALRTIMKQIIRRPASEVGIVLVDLRRSHLEEVPPEYLLTYCTSTAHAAQNAAELAGSLKERLPGPDVTPQQLRDRSWWKGLEVFIVVDDYDMVTTSQGNPLAPLLPLLPQARDLGFHLILSRRTGGAARALYEPLLQTVTDGAAPGLLFSGDRMEGRLLNGVAPTRLPAGRALFTHRGEAPVPVQIALP